MYTCEHLRDDVEYWLSRGNNIELFPRKVLVVDRNINVTYWKEITNIDKICKYIVDKSNNPRLNDWYVSMYSDVQIENSKIDTVVFDINVDDSNIDNVWELLRENYDALQTFRSFLVNNDYDFSRVTVSGRGFHAYIDFDLYDISYNDFKQLYKEFVVKFNNEHGNILTLKMHRGEFTERILYTPNSKLRTGYGIYLKLIDYTKSNLNDALSIDKYKNINKYDGFINFMKEYVGG